MTKAKKISLLVSIAVILVGAVMFAIMGFNYDLSYGTAKRIVVPMKDDFAIEDYKSFAKEIYGEAKVEVISVFKEGVSIKVKETSDEQLDKLVSKVNEKYNYEYTKEDLKVTELPKVEPYTVVELEEAVYAPYVQRGNFPVLVEKITCKGIRPVPNKNM